MFQLHIPDLEFGQAVLLDAGDKEILVDAGSNTGLREYLDAEHVIDGPIELVVITHAHIDHFRGLAEVMEKYSVLEVWDSGVSPDSTPNSAYAKYLATLGQVQRVCRPLRRFYPPSLETRSIGAVRLSQLPGIQLTVLNAPLPVPDRPAGHSGTVDLNNASVVIMAEIAGVRVLFPGDATATRVDDRVQPLEPALVELAEALPGALAAQILVAPHHGSPSGSSMAFIDAVNPDIVAISAHTKYQIPSAPVLARYRVPTRRVFVTDRHVEDYRDHIVVTAYGNRSYQCRYVRTTTNAEHAWEGTLADGSTIDESGLRDVFLTNERRVKRPERVGAQEAERIRTCLKGADLSGANLSGASLADCDLGGANLSEVRLEGADLRGANLSGANLRYANLTGAQTNGAAFVGADLIGARLPLELKGVDLANANLSHADLRLTDLSDANMTGASLAKANMCGCRLMNASLQVSTIENADLTGATFEPLPGANLPVRDLVIANYLSTLRFARSPHALVEIRNTLEKAGARDAERQVTFAIEHGKRLEMSWPGRIFGLLFFELPCAYGMEPGRPLWILTGVWAGCAAGYLALCRWSRRSGINLVVSRRNLRDTSKLRTHIAAIGRSIPSYRVRGLRSAARRLRVEVLAVLMAMEFSVRSAFNLKFQWLEAGTWVRLLHRREYEFEPVGWVRTLSGVQALVSLYLLALWVLCYFGRPFG